MHTRREPATNVARFQVRTVEFSDFPMDVDQGFSQLAEMLAYLQAELHGFEATIQNYGHVVGKEKAMMSSLVSRMGQVHQTVVDNGNRLNHLRCQPTNDDLPAHMEQVYSSLQMAHTECMAVKSETAALTSTLQKSTDETQVILPPSEDGLPTMLCCDCGTPMTPNPTRRCMNCLKSDIDITEGVQRHVILQKCSGCDRWNRPPWLTLKQESPEMLSYCLKRVRNLDKVKVTEAKFLYTDPSHNLIRVRVVVEKEVMGKALLRQGLTIEFKPTNLQCRECALAWTPHSLNTTVHVRQRTPYKRTILFLENVVRHADAHKKSIAINSQTDGLDFHFSGKNPAVRFADFLLSNFPCRKMESAKLLTHEEQNATAHLKHSIAVEIAPVCKDDLILIGPKTCKRLGGVPPIQLCTRVGSQIDIIDPFTLRGTSLKAKDWWKETGAYEVMMTKRDLTDFVVLDTEEIALNDVKTTGTARRYLEGSKRKLEKSQAQSVSVLSSRFPGSVVPTGKFRLVELELARVQDLGHNDDRIRTRTHIGLHIKVGDIVSGYNVQNYNRGNCYNYEGVEEADLVMFPVFVCRIKKPEEACLDVGAWDSQAISSSAYKEKAASMVDVARVQDLDDVMDPEDFTKMNAELEDMLRSMTLESGRNETF